MIAGYAAEEWYVADGYILSLMVDMKLTQSCISGMQANAVTAAHLCYCR